MTLAGINATAPPRRPTFTRQEVAMIETRDQKEGMPISILTLWRAPLLAP